MYHRIVLTSKNTNSSCNNYDTRLDLNPLRYYTYKCWKQKRNLDPVTECRDSCPCICFTDWIGLLRRTLKAPWQTIANNYQILGLCATRAGLVEKPHSPFFRFYVFFSQVLVCFYKFNKALQLKKFPKLSSGGSARGSLSDNRIHHLSATQLTKHNLNPTKTNSPPFYSNAAAKPPTKTSRVIACHLFLRLAVLSVRVGLNDG